MLKVRTTGGRQYSRDLRQGGVELSCVLIFEGDSKDLSKVKKLVSPILTSQSQCNRNPYLPSESKEKLDRFPDLPSESKKRPDHNSDLPPESKKKKLDSAAENEKENCSDHVAADEEEWICCGSIILSRHDKEIISSGQRLTDKHINFAHSF